MTHHASGWNAASRSARSETQYAPYTTRADGNIGATAFKAPQSTIVANPATGACSTKAVASTSKSPRKTQASTRRIHRARPAAISTTVHGCVPEILEQMAAMAGWCTSGASQIPCLLDVSLVGSGLVLRLRLSVVSGHASPASLSRRAIQPFPSLGRQRSFYSAW